MAIAKHTAKLELPPLSILRMVWKHRLLIALLTAVLGAGATAGIYLLPDVYRAEAVILVDGQKIPEKFVASTVQASPQDSLASLRQQILSASRLQKIISEMNLYPEERKTQSPEEVIDLMRRELKIAFDKSWTGSQPGAFRITYEGRSPHVIAGVVNQIASLFIGENLKSREMRASNTSEFLDRQLETAKKALDDQEAALSQYKVRFTGELPQQENALLAAQNSLNAALQSNQDALNRAQQNKVLLESNLRLAESSVAALARSAMQTESGKRPPQPGSVPTPPIRQSDALRQQLQTARLRYSDEHPEVRRMKLELDAVLREESRAPAASPRAAKNEEVPNPVIPAQLTADFLREKERITEAKTQLDLVKQEIESRTAEQVRIRADIARYQQRIESLPVREQQMSAMTRDFETSRQNYKSLLDKKITADMSAEMEREQQSERFTLIEAARLPSVPVKPRRLLFYPLAWIAALAAGLAVAVAIELSRNQLLGEWELPSDVPVLARVSVIDISKAGMALQRQTRIGS